MSDAPRRIQLRRTKGWRMPDQTVSVARPTKWGNPWRVENVQGVGWCCADPGTNVLTTASSPAAAHAMAVARFEASLAQQPDLVAAARQDLRGRNLACWCPASMPCHADTWLRIANAPLTGEAADA